jgi:hypothetical protein
VDQYQQMPVPTQPALKIRDASESAMPAFTWTTRTLAAQPAMTMGGLIIPLHKTDGPSATRTAGSSATRTPHKGLPISLVNKMDSNNIKMYMSGLDRNGSLIFLDQSGVWYYPQATSSLPQPIPQNVEFSLGGANTTLNFVTPGYIRSARIWISQGPLHFYSVSTPDGPGLVQPAAVNPVDPNSLTNYGFAELDWEEHSGLYADITAVDFVGLPLGMELIDGDDNRFTALGTPANAAPVLCDMLKKQGSSIQPWGKQYSIYKNRTYTDPHLGDLCVYNAASEVVRVISPGNLVAQQPAAFDGVFDDYVNHVYAHYSFNDLVIITQTDHGNVSCRVHDDDKFHCDGDNRAYAKPTAADIFGCNSGPFAIQKGDNSVHYAIVPRLCAAFNRATLLLPGGDQQPGPRPPSFYTAAPNNWYSKFTHQLEVAGGGYAFAYDDVELGNGDSAAGLLSSMNPAELVIYIGGS